MVNKRVQNVICFHDKSFNIIGTQVCAPTTDSEEAEVEQFCEDL